MTSPYRTEQEAFWAGEFGDEYVDRNAGARWVASNTALFSQILRRTHDVRSVIEFGANIGQNLAALRNLLPTARLSGVEINQKAVEHLRSEQPDVDVYHQSLLEFSSNEVWDLTFTKGVLIHINPCDLERVYQKLYAHSRQYLLVAEYYNPAPVEITYRGHEGKLFKRDFAGDLLDRFADLRLIDYGFAYHRDPNFPQDDSSWFVLEKAGARRG